MLVGHESRPSRGAAALARPPTGAKTVPKPSVAGKRRSAAPRKGDAAITVAPLLDAPAIIQLHVAAAIPAPALAPLPLWAPRRGALHRRLGRVRVAAMAVLALSGLATSTNGLSF